MLILNPRHVRFGSLELEDVRSVAIDRAASRQVVEWSDLGPHAVFADAPERKVTIKLVRELSRDGLDGPLPGDAQTFSLRTSANASDAGGSAISSSAVVMRVTHELTGQSGALQRIELIAISASGDQDPVTIETA